MYRNTMYMTNAILYVLYICAMSTFKVLHNFYVYQYFYKVRHCVQRLQSHIQVSSIFFEVDRNVVVAIDTTTPCRHFLQGFRGNHKRCHDYNNSTRCYGKVTGF